MTVRPPLIRECLANIDCKVIDIVEKRNVVVLGDIAADLDSVRKARQFTLSVTEPSLSTGARLPGRR